MKFSPIGTAKSNGILFSLQYGEFLNGEPQENRYFIHCEKRGSEDSANNDFIFASTEATHRFPTRAAAKQFCQEIASGSIDLETLKDEMLDAGIQAAARRREAAEQEFHTFAKEASELNIDVVDLNRLLQRYHALSHDAKRLLQNEEYCSLVSAETQHAGVPFDGDHMNVVSPELLMPLCALLKNNHELYVKPLPNDPDAYIAYAVNRGKTPSGLPFTRSEEIPVLFTSPSAALTSTIEGRIAWAEHLHNKAQSQGESLFDLKRSFLTNQER